MDSGLPVNLLNLHRFCTNILFVFRVKVVCDLQWLGLLIWKFASEMGVSN